MNSPLLEVLRSVQCHPGTMSPLLLEYLLRGEPIGRLAEKGLTTSPFYGRLREVPAGQVARAIEEALIAGWLVRVGGFYPALQLAATGEGHLVSTEGGAVCREAAPDLAYRAYYRARQTLARSRRTPPYRIFPNMIVSHLATRRPTTLEDLLQIPGLGKRRALRYHSDLLAVGRQLNDAGV